ncbi:hypothetical protein Syun_009303 [Stephania yunnanensis]|uniref:Uncharacterized protein n=1 Tax=Stephania yunnanensis TaxID=152371 RepID=A0AAP0KG45_9MAGN
MNGVLLMAQSTDTVEVGVRYLDTHLLHRSRSTHTGPNDLQIICNACQLFLKYQFNSNGLLPQ